MEEKEKPKINHAALDNAKKAKKKALEANKIITKDGVTLSK